MPQGYAYGIWVLLETKFRNTEQDNVGDLWAQFVNLAQEPEEKFDEYKARADAVLALLTHAKETPPAGLYSYVLLWKLQPRYEHAVLALKASGQIKEPARIDWASIVAFMSNHERSQGRYDGREGEDGSRAFATRSRGQAQTQAHGSNMIECYNCGEKGHIARNCEQGRRRRGDKRSETRGAHRDRRTVQQDEPADRSSSDDEDEDDDTRDAQRRHKREPGGERANAVRSHVADRRATDRGKGGQPYAQESEDEEDGVVNRSYHCH